MPEEQDQGRSAPQWLGTSLAIVAVGLTAFAQWEARRHWLPGNWPGDEGFMFPHWQLWLVGALLATVFAAGVLARLRRWVPLCCLLLIVGAMFSIQWPADWRYRWNAEHASYMHAVKEGAVFGDQHSETVDGRRLIYWRWHRWDIDNGEGVLYDPEDRLNKDSNADVVAFKGATGGVLWKVERIEPNWYYVQHS